MLSDPLRTESNHSVTFLEPPNQEGQVTESNVLIDELFGSSAKPTVDTPWASGILDFARTTVCTGLEEDRRNHLIKQYEVKDNLAILGPPKLNKLLIPVLKASASTMKRDDYQSQSQAQVAASLNAFGSAISELMGLGGKRLLPEEANPSLKQLADGFHLLTDHQHRLSLARRAFIKPSLSLVGKNATDNAPVDEWLFGSSFAEDLKAAQACEKAAKDLLKSTPSAAKPNIQPIRQLTTKRQFQPRKATGNAKAPARQTSSSARRAGASRPSSRHRRFSSRSRRR